MVQIVEAVQSRPSIFRGYWASQANSVQNNSKNTSIYKTWDPTHLWAQPHGSDRIVIFPQYDYTAPA